MPIEEEIINHSDEVQEIIAAVPSWILRWGIVLVFCILAGIVGLSALIKYPDVVKMSLKVVAGEAPKVVVAKQNGRIIALLVKEDQQVQEGQALVYLESTANHKDVIALESALLELRTRLGVGEGAMLKLPENGLALGELQADYQNFYQRYLQYRATQQSGYYQRKRQFLEKDLKEVMAQRRQIEKEKEVQEQSFKNTEATYEAYKKLYAQKVISLNEYREQENKYLGGKSPLQQNESALLNNGVAYMGKEKELFDLEHTVSEEKASFLQSLNSLVVATEAWLLRYVPKAPVAGKLSYGGTLQVNQNVVAGQDLFVVNSGSSNFYGEINIPQQNMGKVSQGQQALVKLHSYPYEQFGMIRGKIGFIADAAYRDSIFTAKVKFEQFENKDPRFKITLKNGMLASAEIITEDNTLLQRFARSLTAMLRNN